MTQDSLAILSKAASPLRSAAALQIGNARFQNALARRSQSSPPIWLMRQAGRYHKHYQALREKYSFMDLCKRPELSVDAFCLRSGRLAQGITDRIEETYRLVSAVLRSDGSASRAKHRAATE